jgi:glycosyltransferase involved in cell wall biosynthesis
MTTDTPDPRHPVLISVVLPVYNAAGVVGQQLDALAGQTYPGAWELVVADNGSTDASAALAEGWGDRIPGLRLVDASARRGAAAARNLGAQAAGGDILAFCDADDVAAPGWLAALATALEDHDFVAGRCDHQALNPGAMANWHARSFETGLPVTMDFLPYATSANMAVSRAAFFEVDGFDEDFNGLGAAGEDIDLSWRLQLAGHRLHFEPGALIYYRHRHDLRGVWRQNFHYGTADVLLYKRYRAHGLQPRPMRQVMRGFRGLLVRAPALARRGSRGRWLRDAGHRLGRVQGSAQERILFL